MSGIVKTSEHGIGFHRGTGAPVCADVVSPWRTLQAAGFAPFERVDRFNNRRLPGPAGDIPPARAGAAYHVQLERPAMAA